MLELPEHIREEHLHMKLTKNIELQEMLCPCGCMGFVYNEDLVTGLQRIRNAANVLIGPYEVKIRITSGFRCKKHNQAIGGASRSYHTKGMAADIKLYIRDKGEIRWMKPSYMFWHVIMPLEAFNGVGVYRGGKGSKGFCHVDVRPLEKYEMWVDSGNYRIYLSECDKEGSLAT